ncbi:MAG TPA: rhodanese-like domain-containing protein [Gemmatimonadaceae bacterium]|nr:rhodanese-like domain-containing protein [Gemmatimonadaceae bacterium]
MRSLHALPALVLVLSPAAAGLAGQSAPAPVLVTTDWLAAHLNEPGLVVVHVSAQRSDYDAGHVPGSRWLSWQSITRQRDGLSTELPDAAALDSALESLGVSDGSRIVISGGPITMTARAYFTLDYFGLGDRTSLLDGGIDAWREEGRAVERTAPAVARGTLALRPQPGKLADASWIASQAATPGGPVVIDARAPEFWAGLASNNNPRPGRLPMAAGNLPFTWTTGEFARYRDRDRLAQLFARAGVKPGNKVVTYCHIGMQASVLYVAARLLGYDAAVYDGSFEDWSRRTELPVAAPPKPPQP